MFIELVISPFILEIYSEIFSVDRLVFDLSCTLSERKYLSIRRLNVHCPNEWSAMLMSSAEIGV